MTFFEALASSAGTTIATTTTAGSTSRCTCSARSASSSRTRCSAVEPGAAAVLIAWLLAMPSRQIGHFFVRAEGLRRASTRRRTSTRKTIKVGYNLRRKVVLMSAWSRRRRCCCVDPTLGGLFAPRRRLAAFVDNVAHALAVVCGSARCGAGPLQLCVIQRRCRPGSVWCTKILTDPFHDVMLYLQGAPLHLLRGELLDPIGHRPTDERVSGHRAQHADPALDARGSCQPTTWCHHQPSSSHGQRRRRRTDSATAREVGVGVVVAEDQTAAADPAERQALRREGSTETSSCSATARCSAWSTPSARFATRTGQLFAWRAARSSVAARPFHTRVRGRVATRAPAGASMRRRNSFIAPITYGCELNVPRAKQMSAGGRRGTASSGATWPHDDADRQSAADGLAVGDHVGVDAEVLLRAAVAPAGSRGTPRRRSGRCAAVQTARSCCSQAV